MLWETAQLLLIEDQCDLKKGEVVLQCVGGGSGAGAWLGAARVHGMSRGGKQPPGPCLAGLQPCSPPAGWGATGEVSRPTSLPRAGARPLCRGREQESWPAGLISSGEGERELELCRLEVAA